MISGMVRERRNALYDFAVIDEAQDISVAQLRFLAALGGDRPNSLFFAGDSGQRIFQTPFSWKSLGVEIRGRSQKLRINYRTSHQIRMQADRLLGPEVADVDGNVENRKGTVSVFNGPNPVIQVFDTISEASDLNYQGTMSFDRDLNISPFNELFINPNPYKSETETFLLSDLLLSAYEDIEQGLIAFSTNEPDLVASAVNDWIIGFSIEHGWGMSILIALLAIHQAKK